jgi:hypothetical protein
MARHKITGDELVLHDGSSAVPFRQNWDFTGEVTVTDDSLGNQTIIEIPDAGGISFQDSQWSQWGNITGYEPSALAYPYNVPFDAVAYTSDDTSWLDLVNTDSENGKFAFAATGLYSVCLQVEEPESSFPAEPHGYEIISELRNFHHQAPLQIIRGGATDMVLGCSINFTEWIAAGDAFYVRLRRGNSVTTITSMSLDLTIARILG